MFAFLRKTGRTERLIERQRRRYYLKNNLLSLYATLRLARNPQATKYVFMIGDTQDNIAESERRLGRYPDPFNSSALEALWQSGYRAERYDLAELAKLPPHTLGGAYARHMQANDLSVDYYPEVKARNRMQFLRQRMRQTHDVWHVLTGFGTDEFEEVGIQGFYAGQGVSSMAAFIGAGAFVKSVLKCRFRELHKHMDSFCEGYCAGKRAESLLAVKWEELWAESVESLRRRYRITSRAREAAPVQLKAVA
ncbi:MAG TPA: Coq4 family protein [Burkholderiales bacterium]|nr:Coq4 family protein [Burkholderiales bacterium]